MRLPPWSTSCQVPSVSGRAQLYLKIPSFQRLLATGRYLEERSFEVCQAGAEGAWKFGSLSPVIGTSPQP